MKNSNDITGNRTRDVPTCSAEPQPTSLTYRITSGVLNELEKDAGRNDCGLISSTLSNTPRVTKGNNN